MTQKTKLELTWPGKHKRPRLEPRILLEVKVFSCCAGSGLDIRTVLYSRG